MWRLPRDSRLNRSLMLLSRDSVTSHLKALCCIHETLGTKKSICREGQRRKYSLNELKVKGVALLIRYCKLVTNIYLNSSSAQLELIKKLMIFFLCTHSIYTFAGILLTNNKTTTFCTLVKQLPRLNEKHQCVPFQVKAASAKIPLQARTRNTGECSHVIIPEPCFTKICLEWNYHMLYWWQRVK